jgi:hypothetical protein
MRHTDKAGVAECLRFADVCDGGHAARIAWNDLRGAGIMTCAMVGKFVLQADGEDRSLLSQVPNSGPGAPIFVLDLHGTWATRHVIVVDQAARRGQIFDG